MRGGVVEQRPPKSAGSPFFASTLGGPLPPYRDPTLRLVLTKRLNDTFGT